MTPEAAPNSIRADKPRQGKWTKEEESYVDLLIEEFRCGALPIRQGTTLRNFLSKMINCNPKRVSKKYENSNYNGKHKYEPSTIPLSMEEMRRRRERLQEHERRFLRALQNSEDDLDLDPDDEGLKASLKGSRSATLNKDSTEANKMEDRIVAGLLEQHNLKTAASTMRAPPRDNGFNARLTAELQMRMDRAKQLSGSRGGAGAASAEMHDLSIYNSAELTITLPVGRFSPLARGEAQMSGCRGNKSMNQLASFDMMSSLRQAKLSCAGGTGTGGLPGHLADTDDDPPGWQVRLQKLASGSISCDKSRAAHFQLPHYLLQSKYQESALKANMPFPNLPDLGSRRHLNHASNIDHLSQLQLGSLILREERQSLSSPSSGMIVSHIVGGTRRSSLVSELEIMESLKRGLERQEAMDSFRPSKRLR